MPLKTVPVPDLIERIGNSIDLFICCGSFEDRCLSAALALPPDKVKFALVAEHTDLHRYVGPNTEKLREHFRQGVEAVELDTRSPIRSADRLTEGLERARRYSPTRIVLDITTFTHETLVIAAEVISRTFGGFGQLQCVYTIAEEYDPGQGDESKWLSKGIAEIRSVLGFPGAVLPGRGTHLILLHGFEEERSKSLIARYEPDVLSLGAPMAKSFTSEKHCGRNQRVHEEVSRYSRNSVAEVIEFEFPANHPFGCRDAILQQMAVRSNLNTIVAPMNTKVSTLGVMLAARANQEIQICYAQPNSYNVENYSKPSLSSYIFTLED